MSIVACDCARVVVNIKARRKAFNKSLLLSAAAIALIAPPAAQANPVGAAVTTGSASVSASANKTSVNQKSEDVVINWSSFNIGAGQTTQFVQPNAQAIAVNRVGGANASQILGTLDANGRVVLINGNGMLFGKGAQVNVGSLIATSTDGSDSDVLSGKFTQAGKQNASVINNGTIMAASGGLVALVAPNVTNTGIVNAKLGTVALGAANKFTVDFSGDGLVSFAAQGDVNARASAINSGLLSGANVSMTAHAANGIATGIVNMSGVITAQGVQNIGGTITLNAGNGTLTTTGTLNAAGATGGGHIETSGETAIISGHITAGKGGLWKVDPEDLTIDSNAATTIDGALNGGTSVLEQTTSGAASGTGNQTSGAGDINVVSALSWNSMATLTLDAYHSLDIEAPITISGAGGLVLQYNDAATDGVLSFGLGPTGFAGNVSYGATNNDGTLTVNGTPYTLLYSTNDVQNVNNNLTGNYALADSLDATGTGWTPLGINSGDVVQNGGNGFAGVFEGLGNTISNLAISVPSINYVGLFGYASGTIRDLGVIGGKDKGNTYVGGLAGYSSGTIDASYATAVVSAGSTVGGLVGESDGTIDGSYATGAVSIGTGGTNAGGLAGLSDNTITDSYATGAVTAGNSSYSAGGLVGFNEGTIVDAYATGAVSAGTNSNYTGGLAGFSNSAITDSYATGAVGAGSGSHFTGGLAGFNAGAIVDSYAMGAVSGDAEVGGLVGENYNTVQSIIDDSYATGAVSGNTDVGGLIGDDTAAPGQVVSSYWDMQTSGIADASQGAGNVANDPGITGETTSALQGALPGGFDSTVWGTGTGLYPYLLWQYPSGTPQAITGIAYSNDGGSVLQGVTVSTLLDGNALGTASTGANGYYYLLVAPGTITDSNNAVLAYSSANGARVDTATDALDTNNNVSGFDVWGNTLIAPTSDATYSTASTTSLQTQDAALIAQAIGANTDPTAGLTNYGYIATGASFTIDQPLTLTNGLYVKSGNIAVDDAVTLPGSEGLTLDSYGALTVDAPISITGAGALVLDYSTASVTNLSFGLTSSGFIGSVSYGATNNGGTLVINGTPYTLVYSMSDMQNIDASDVALVGNYALAESLDATSTTGWVPIGTRSNSFGGTFEGLGNTISNLTVDLPSVSGVGLFGYATGSVFRDLGVVGGSITGVDLVGGLVGDNIQGTIANAYATGSVSGGSEIGGLVGSQDFLVTITNAYATGAVSGSLGVGGLVGRSNFGRITNAYATGAVDDIGSGLSQYFGGLVGLVVDGGGIFDAYATGAVMGSSSGVSEYGGGLVGANQGGIIDAYATGSVSGFRVVGGLVGANYGGIFDAYATGSVSGNGGVGGLVGGSVPGAMLTDGYWDTQTSGQSSDAGGATPLTTAQMQGTFTNMSGFAGPTWSTGSGLYPYLSWQFTGTPQAISGIAYSNGGGTVLQGGTVSTLLDGNALGTVSTGANGYYYLLVAPGTISDSSHALLAYSSANGARVDTATDALDTNNNVSSFDVWGNTLIAPTSDTTYSSASATILQTQDASLITQAIGGNANPTTGLTNYGYIANSASFTIDQPLTLSNGLYVKTTSGNIVVDDALTLPGSEGLALDSYGALTVDAPISITGAGALVLDYSTASPTNLSFGLTSTGFTGNINYGATDNDGTLSINGTPYTLVYSMSDMQNIDASDVALVGNYALAESLDATSTTGWVPIGTRSNSFGGTFEGLGNTISNLTVDLPSVSGVGLFGYATGSVFRDLGVVGGSTTGADLVGALVGNIYQGTIANAYATGSVSGDSGIGGLVGYQDLFATITNAYATGAVSGSQDVGGLVGRNGGNTITDVYATGAVDDIGSGLSQYFGGLVGLNDHGSITNAYATGAVTGSGSGVSDYGGGLVGGNNADIADVYATGAVGGFRVVGGLVGVNGGNISDAYATGTVSGYADVGGLVGGISTGASLTDGYWDTQTSGQSSDGGGATPLTTAQMQGTFTNMSGFAGPTWSTGAGLYPYLSWQFTGTPQAISGIAYSNGGGTVLQGGTVSTLLDGNALGTVSTGANGYYYLLVAPGTIPAGNDAVLAYSSASGVRLDTATDALDTNSNVSSFDVWGNTLIAPTSDTTYSTASATSLQTQDAALITQAVGANTNPTTGLTNYGYIATGSGFTIDQPLTLSNGLYVKTTSGNIVVDDALTLPGSEGLTLDSNGSLTIDAPITVNGAGSVIMGAGYDTTTVPGNSVLELSFGSGDHIAYATGGGEGISGQSLTINGAAYTLVYSTTDLQNVNNSLNGDYALANALDASSATGWIPLGTESDGSVLNGGHGFNGIFEGLGNTISNFSLNLPGISYVGLFGFAGVDSTIRDLALSGGSITGNGEAYVGALAGEDDGIVDNAQANLAVSGGDNDVGGLVGSMGLEIENSSASGTVTSTGDAFAGGLVGYANDTIVSSHASGSVTSGNGAYVGGLSGDSSGSIIGSYATGNVTAQDSSYAGGLAGFVLGSIENSHAAGNATAGRGSVVGGLSGSTSGEIANSYATGSATAGNQSWAGGLTGISGNDIMESYATGAVSGGAQSYVGGLAGENVNSIKQSYATGAVSGAGANYVGGLVGLNDDGATITQTYATGRVAPGSGTNIGGLVGDDDADPGNITYSYWDMQTSGIGATHGAGNITSDSGITGETTSGLQGVLPGGFSNTVWSTGTGLYPYLSWQFSGTPQAISGTVFSGSTALAGENVGLLIDGSAVAPAITAGSGANGYYYILLAPGTISGSGSDVVTYLTSGTPANTFVQDATGSLAGVELFENTFLAASHASDSAAILAEIPTALGSASGPQFLYTAASGVVPGVNLVIVDTAAAFTLDSSLDVGNAILELYTTGSDTQTSGTITANQLISISTGGLSLGDSNAIATLGNIVNSGSGGISMTDARALTVAGSLSTGTGAIALTTTGAGNGIAIDDHLVGGTVDLISAGTIRENGTNGFIHASVLEGSSDGYAFFNGANKIGALGNFSTAGAGAFSLYDWETLDVTGALSTGKHSITLDTQVGDLDIGGSLSAGTIALTSLTGEVTGAGIVDAKLLNVSADTGIDLYGTNNDIQSVGTDTTNSGPNIINSGH